MVLVNVTFPLKSGFDNCYDLAILGYSLAKEIVPNQCQLARFRYGPKDFFSKKLVKNFENTFPRMLSQHFKFLFEKTLQCALCRNLKNIINTMLVIILWKIEIIIDFPFNLSKVGILEAQNCFSIIISMEIARSDQSLENQTYRIEVFIEFLWFQLTFLP